MSQFVHFCGDNFDINLWSEINLQGPGCDAEDQTNLYNDAVRTWANLTEPFGIEQN